ncbi:alpha/beta fold hydrolase [Yunchengibacter salinarum]|uniref:alpha/beta fold hydrolase n=1 Tax=Yunchengibacter salinarum TaxID=3133399 RepID=UPI0035B571E4
MQPHTASETDRRDGTVTLSDGFVLHYRDCGSGPALLFLHGWAMDGTLARLDGAPPLQGFRLIAPDLRGHGRSRVTDPKLSVDQLADDVAELISALNLNRVILWGWSMGAMLGWLLIRRHGTARLAGMIVEDMSPRATDTPDWPHGLRDGHSPEKAQGLARYMADHWANFCPHFVARVPATGRTGPEGTIMAACQRAALNADPVSMAALWRSLVVADARDVADGLDLPHLLLPGTLSQLYTDAAARWLHARLKNSVLTPMEGAGHAPHLEVPAAFEAALQGFARSLCDTSRTTTPGAGPSPDPA